MIEMGVCGVKRVGLYLRTKLFHNLWDIMRHSVVIAGRLIIQSVRAVVR